MHNDAAMNKLLVRLDAMAEEANTLLSEIGILADCFVKQHGISDRHVQEYAIRLLEQWHSTDAT